MWSTWLRLAGPFIQLCGLRNWQCKYSMAYYYYLQSCSVYIIQLHNQLGQRIGFLVLESANWHLKFLVGTENFSLIMQQTKAHALESFNSSFAIAIWTTAYISTCPCINICESLVWHGYYFITGYTPVTCLIDKPICNHNAFNGVYA